jgi:uncharacterized protein YjbJ (UPF0337 family)
MSDQTTEGTINDLKGKVKDAAGGLTGDAATQAEGKADQVIGEAQGAMGDAAEKVSGAASSAADYASDLASRAGSKLHGTAQTVKEGAASAGGRIYEAGAQAGDYVGYAVERQPLLSLLGAAAVGYFIGYLVHSSSSPFAPRRSFRDRWL